MDHKQALVDRLIAVSSTWNEHDLVPKSEQQEVRNIGIELNRIGGFDLMQESYYAAKAKNRCAAPIQAYWDGIGEWRW